ncbi:MAG: hypothetical protein U5K74_02300 [Gemmatimonadaceae bacterium]|nr:hypothetical protein [Gemmatimonadaceae bacterium]
MSLAATVLDRDGDVVPGASVRWSISEPTMGEISGDELVVFRPGSVTVTATSGAATARRTITVRRLTVLSVTVGFAAPLPLTRGAMTPIGVRAEGEGGRIVLGRTATLASDDPSIVRIDSAGRLHAVAAGVTTIRAVVDGTVGTLRVTVAPDDAVLTLHRLAGTRLPARAESFVADGRSYEYWLEGGQLSIGTDGLTRYTLSLRYALYEVVIVNGARSLRFVNVAGDLDSGVMDFGAAAGFVLRSEAVGNLTHNADAVTGGMQVRFRVPGDDDIRDLFFRAEPE